MDRRDRHPLKARAALLAFGLASAVNAAVISDDLTAALAGRRPDETVPVIVGFADRIDPAEYRGKGRRERREPLVRALREKAGRTQGPVARKLIAAGARNLRQLWLSNSLAAEVPVGLIPQLEQMVGVESIRFDAALEVPPLPQPALAAPPRASAATGTSGWNLDAVGAPRLWALGVDGRGTVVASLDTGVDRSHPDLQAKWRGGANSWFDPSGRHSAPYDASGHGTQAMGLMVGGSAIGVAPGARWIAAKIFDDDGRATYSAIHLAFQWTIDPDGDAATDDAPDVINNAWGLAAAGVCSVEFAVDLEVLRAAGINVVFAGGNFGAAPASSVSPANNRGGFGVGALDPTGLLATYSSRGPSACDGGYYPRLAAPGTKINTATLSFGGGARYAAVSGTSFAAAHAAGALALLLQAFPHAGVEALETALADTARDLGGVGSDNGYGHGAIDVAAAYAALQAAPPAPPANLYPVARDDGAATRRGLAVAIPVVANDADADGGIDPASVAIVAKPLHGVAAARGDGSVEYTPRESFVGTDTFGYAVRDDAGAVSNRATVTVTVGW